MMLEEAIRQEKYNRFEEYMYHSAATIFIYISYAIITGCVFTIIFVIGIGNESNLHENNDSSLELRV